MRRTSCLFAATLLLAGAGPARRAEAQAPGGTVTASPGVVTILPTQTSGPVLLTITFPPPTAPGNAAVAIGGLPAGVGTTPAALGFAFTAGQTSASVSFRFVASAAAFPSTYPLSLAASSQFFVAVGGMTLIIAQPNISASASPNPVSLVAGGGAQNVTVTTSPDPGFSQAVTYSFLGFPAGIAFGGPQSGQPPYPSRTFPFQAAANVAAGTYSGVLRLSFGFLVVVIRDFPFTVAVTQPSFTASAAPNPVTLVQNGPVVNVSVTTNAEPFFSASAITYTFTGFPAGIGFGGPKTALAPSYPPVVFPFTASAGTTPGTYSGSLQASYLNPFGQPATKTFPFTVVVPAPDIAASFTPAVVPLCNGGPAGQTTLTLDPLNGFTGTPRVTVRAPLPAGINVTSIGPVGNLPPSQSVPITVTAAGAAPGPNAVSLDIVGPGVAKVATFTVNVVAPDYTPSVSPLLLDVAAGGPPMPFQAGLAPVACFNQPVSVSPSGAPAFLGISPASGTLLPAGYAPVTFNAQAAAGATPGTYPITFTFLAGNGPPKQVTAQVRVVVVADFSLTADPPSRTILAGQASTVTLATVFLNGFTGPLTVAAPAAANLVFTPASLTFSASGSQTVNVAVKADSPGGTFPGSFTGSGPGVGTKTAPFAVTVTLRPPVIGAVTPSALFPGFPATVTVDGNDFQPGAAIVTSAADLSISGVTFVSPQRMRFTARLADAAPAGPRSVFVRNPDGQTSNAGILSARALPAITSISPPAVATGTKSATLTLTGLNFEPGAIVTVRPSGPVQTSGPDVTVEGTTVLSPTLAKVAVTVRSDAQPGPYLLDLTNPDGGRAGRSATVVVTSSDSVGAPVGVTAAAIVSPLPGQLLSPDKPVLARGVLATTGTGSIIGVWLFDGVPFDRFAVIASAGFPVELSSHIPIPESFAGSHVVQLAIEVPQRLVTPAIEVVQSVESQTRLRILGPADGTIVGRTLPLLRWTIVPGGSGYEVELLKADGKTRERLVRVSADSWIPSPKDVAGLGPGVHLWRVRAVFPANVEGGWTPTRRLVFLPAQVALSLETPGVDPVTKRGLLKWTGGAPGLLYRVDFFGPGQMRPGFSALTARSEYVLPPGSPWSVPDVRVRVTAFGSDGLPRGVSPVVAIPKNAFRRDPSGEFLFAQSAPAVTGTTPRDGETVSSATPAVGATWSGSVAMEDVALFIDSTDVTPVAELTPSSIGYTPLVPLPAGARSARLSLAGQITTWSFTVPAEAAGAPAAELPAAAGGEGVPADAAQPPEPGAEATPPQIPPPAVRTEWVLTALGTVTLVRTQDQPDLDQGRLQLTGQVDLATASGAFDGKATADIVGRHDFTDPHHTVNESRNWLVRVGANQPGSPAPAAGAPTAGFREEAIVGYAAPAFLDQAQIMTAGLARGGVLGRVATPWLSASYYQSFDPRPAGLIAGTFGPEQKIKAAALEAPGDPGKLVLRAIGFQVEDQPGFNSAGGKGKLWGGFGKYVVGPELTIIAEGAHGDFTPNEGSAETERAGNAFRLGLLGSIGTFSYTLNALHTDANFVNPANRGFTPGGVSDRTGGDLMVNKSFGPLNVGLQYRHLEGGNTSGSTLPKSKEDGGNLNVSMPILPWFNAAATGNITKNTGDADTVHFTPEVDRTQKAANLTLTQTVGGGFSISEALSYQELRDDVNPLSDQTVKMAMLTGGGMLFPNFNLSVNLSGTRSESAPAVGTTDLLLVSVQPALTIPMIFTTLTPRAAYTRSKNDVSEIVSESEQYQVLVQFAPTWVNSLFAIQFAADWNRSQTSTQLERPGYSYRYVGTITLRWGGSYVMGEAPAPPAPPPQMGQRGLPLLPPLVIGARPAPGPAAAAGASIFPAAGGGL